MHKAAQKSFHTLIHTFSLPVSFRMVSSAHMKLRTSLSKQFPLETAGEDRVPVGDE